MKKTAWFSIVPAGLLFTLSLFSPAVSLGHVFLDHTEPRVGSTVSTPPEHVRIWFDGDLEPAFSKMTIKDASGKQVDKGDCRVDASDPKLLVISSPRLAPGTYRVFWDVAGRDGHRMNGDFTFTVK